MTNEWNEHCLYRIRVLRQVSIAKQSGQSAQASDEADQMGRHERREAVYACGITYDNRRPRAAFSAGE